MKKLRLLISLVFIAFTFIACKKNIERKLVSHDGEWIVYKMTTKYYKKTNTIVDSWGDTIRIVFSKSGKGIYYRPVNSKDAHSFTYKTGLSNDLGGFGTTPYIEFSGDAPFYETMYVKKSSKNYQHWENSDWGLLSDYKRVVHADLRRK